MSDAGNFQANFEAPEAAPAPRGRGRPKGVRNRATRDVREATQKRGAAALRLLWKLCNSKDEKVADAALARWLAYAFGRPVDRQELTGADGQPLHPAPAMSDLDLSRFVAFTLTKAAKQAEAPRPPPPQPAARDELVRAKADLDRIAAEPVGPIPEPEPPAAPAAHPEAAPPPMIHTPELLQRTANDR